MATAEASCATEGARWAWTTSASRGRWKLMGVLGVLAAAQLAAAACGAAVEEPDASGPAGDARPADALPADGSGAAPGLSAATWNLERFPLHALTAGLVVAVIESHRFDLIGVQEITDPAAFQALAAALPDYEMQMSTDSGARTRVGFLYRGDRIRVNATEQLFDGDTYEFPREPLLAELSALDASGAPSLDFTFVVLHLKAGVDEASRARRVAGVAQLERWIRSRRLWEDKILVVGDFNDEPTDAPELNVFGPLLDAPDRYRILTQDLEDGGAPSHIDTGSMLDHLVATRELLGHFGGSTTVVLAVDLTEPSYHELVSDHRPVVTHLAW